jgi:hypothetical protein
MLGVMSVEPVRFRALGALPREINVERRIFGVGCWFRPKSATHSGMKSAGDSDLKPATCSDRSRPPVPI